MATTPVNFGEAHDWQPSSDVPDATGHLAGMTSQVLRLAHESSPRHRPGRSAGPANAPATLLGKALQGARNLVVGDGTIKARSTPKR